MKKYTDALVEQRDNAQAACRKRIRELIETAQWYDAIVIDNSRAAGVLNTRRLAVKTGAVKEALRILDASERALVYREQRSA